MVLVLVVVVVVVVVVGCVGDGAGSGSGGVKNCNSVFFLFFFFYNTNHPTGYIQHLPSLLLCHYILKHIYLIALFPDTSLLLCPIPRRPDKCPSDVTDSCVSVSDCESGQKCCFDGCKFRCFGRSGFQPQGNYNNSCDGLLTETHKGIETYSTVMLRNIQTN